MKTFELKTFLAENRESVITKYNELQNEKFFSGITLRDFMVMVMKNIQINNPKSEKRASELLTSSIYYVYNQNVKIEVAFDRDAYKRSQAPNSQWVAII